MATPRVLSLSRSLFTSTPINKQTLTSLLSRSFSSSAAAPSSLSSSFSLLRLRPISAIGFHRISPATPFSLRTFATRQAQTSLNDNSPNWSNRPPKETILLDGCDFEHWLVVTEPPPENATREEIIDSYIKTLAQIVGSEDEARMKIYSVSTRCYFAFGALVPEELSYKLKELPNVRWVLPDSYLDVKNKDYGGEPFINGQAVPYDPKYHEEWIRNNQKAQERNRRNDRPRNTDRSRNFERRQRNQGPGNMGGGPGGNFGGPGGNFNSPPPNMGGQPGGAPNMPPPQNNPGYGQNMPPPNRGGGGMPPPPNYGGQGYPNNNMGNNAMPNYQMPPPNQQNMGNNAMPNYQTPPPNQQNYGPPQGNMGGQPGGGYQSQNMPGRDGPYYQ